MKIKQLIKDRNFYYQKLKRNIFNFFMKRIPFYPLDTELSLGGIYEFIDYVSKFSVGLKMKSSF